MSHRYERVDHHDNDEDLDIHGNVVAPNVHNSPSSAPIPNSPPPSFHSSAELHEPNSDLADSFDSSSDDENDDDMRNLHRSGIGNGSSHNSNFGSESAPLVTPSTAQASTTSIFRTLSNNLNTASSSARRVIVGGGQTDGVFANLSAKPEVGEKLEEHPPSYEQAAADATPPYWETTILAPGMASNVVFIDGLPVGSVFAFVWNALISMSFQFVGFLLTYLLHTTHAAKDGSRAGLGITLVQIGFMMRSKNDDDHPVGETPPAETSPVEPNAYNFDGAPDDAGSSDADSIGKSEWLSYILMVVGWFILIRAISSFLRARRTEQVVLASPERGLGIPVVADNEQPDRAV